MFTITTYADAGGVLVGNKDVQVLIPNGLGDCTVKVIYLEPEFKHLIHEKATWHGMFCGRGLKVYTYDCATNMGSTEIPDGRYQAYYHRGTVWLLYVDNFLPCKLGVVMGREYAIEILQERGLSEEAITEIMSEFNEEMTKEEFLEFVDEYEEEHGL